MDFPRESKNPTVRGQARAGEKDKRREVKTRVTKGNEVLRKGEDRDSQVARRAEKNKSRA